MQHGSQPGASEGAGRGGLREEKWFTGRQGGTFQEEGARKRTGAHRAGSSAHRPAEWGCCPVSDVNGRDVLKEASDVTRFPCERPLRQLSDGGAAGQVAEVWQEGGLWVSKGAE